MIAKTLSPARVHCQVEHSNTDKLRLSVPPCVSIYIFTTCEPFEYNVELP